MQTNDLKLSSKHIDCVLHSKTMFQKLSSSAERPGFWALSSVRPRTPATNGFPPPDLQWGRYQLISNTQLREFMVFLFGNYLQKVGFPYPFVSLLEGA